MLHTSLQLAVHTSPLELTYNTTYLVLVGEEVCGGLLGLLFYEIDRIFIQNYLGGGGGGQGTGRRFKIKTIFLAVPASKYIKSVMLLTTPGPQLVMFDYINP